MRIILGNMIRSDSEYAVLFRSPESCSSRCRFPRSLFICQADHTNIRLAYPQADGPSSMEYLGIGLPVILNNHGVDDCLLLIKRPGSQGISCRPSYIIFSVAYVHAVMLCLLRPRIE